MGSYSPTQIGTWLTKYRITLNVTHLFARKMDFNNSIRNCIELSVLFLRPKQILLFVNTSEFFRSHWKSCRQTCNSFIRALGKKAGFTQSPLNPTKDVQLYQQVIVGLLLRCCVIPCKYDSVQRKFLHSSSTF